MMPNYYGYAVVRKLGHGANGAVFEVTKDNEKYAMKVVEWPTKYDIQEAEILKGINHSNVIKYVDSFYEFYGKNVMKVTIVMEYADKGPLSIQNLHCSELMNWKLLANVVSALSYLHRVPIIHRDLKPDNILCVSTKENEVLYKIGDLGIPKRFDTSTKSRLYTNTIAGTFGYMAPEVLNELEYTCSADLWSLGAVSCFASKTNIHLSTDPKEVKLPIIDSLPNKFSLRLKGIVLKLLKIDPKDRPSADSVFKEATDAIKALFTVQLPPLTTNRVNQPIDQPTNQPQSTLFIPSNISHSTSIISPGQPTPLPRNPFSLTNDPQPTFPIPLNNSHPTSGISPVQPTPLPTVPFFLTNNPQPTFPIPPNT